MARRIVLLPLLAAATLAALAAPAVAASDPPVVVHEGQVTRQDVTNQPGSEPDTVVEPDVAVSPLDHNVAIAAAHDSRFPDGGAVGISSAWTADGGETWHHKTVRGITKATGGSYDRGSDPVVAFGPDGTAYLSVLLIDATTCPSAVAVLRSSDGGRTWSEPFYAHKSASCNYSDDKNWLVVDTSRSSPHYGRVYQFWTPFRYSGNAFLGAPQAVRWSDDGARTWSATSYVTPIDHGTQNSQPMVLPNGAIVDTFYDFGAGNMVPDAVPGARPDRAPTQRQRASARAAAIDATGTIMASTSTDGGATWSPETEVANNAGGYADGVRCCLFAADIDAVTHTMYAAWEGGVGDTDPVYLSFSNDGTSWSSPVRVSRGDVSGVQRVNVDVVARARHVYVGYGTRTKPEQNGGFVQQQLSTSANGGRSFGAPISIGPRSVLKYAAQAGGYFPGDYIGAAIAPGRIYLVWARSSKPPAYSTSPYHQIIYGATLRP
ncbi:MAG: sialidase family protein [Jatrophihabitantaceae bacterium]